MQTVTVKAQTTDAKAETTLVVPANAPSFEVAAGLANDLQLPVDNNTEWHLLADNGAKIMPNDAISAYAVDGKVNTIIYTGMHVA